MFYRQAQFVVLTSIALLLFILCIEVAHMDRAIAQLQRLDLPKFAICGEDRKSLQSMFGPNCANVICDRDNCALLVTLTGK